MTSFRFALLLLLLATPLGNATNQPESNGGAAQVEVGVWLSGLHDVDFLSGSFQTEIYMWWISEDPDFKPFDSLQVLNGRDWQSRAVNTQILPDGRYYTAGFLSVKVSHDWNLIYYPFDRQTLDIVIETPYTADELRLVPQVERSVVSEFVELKGFNMISLNLTEHVANYQTDFGLEDASGTQFSRLVIELELERESGRIVVAILVGFIVANIIALLTFAIDTSQLAIRSSMLGSAIFAAVGNMYLLNSHLDPAVGSMIVDRFAVGTFSVILVALLSGIITHTLTGRGNTAAATTVNRAVSVLLLLLALVFYFATFQSAISAG
jgi:hypothetical protein